MYKIMYVYIIDINENMLHILNGTAFIILTTQS